MCIRDRYSADGRLERILGKCGISLDRVIKYEEGIWSEWWRYIKVGQKRMCLTVKALFVSQNFHEEKKTLEMI